MPGLTPPPPPPPAGTARARARWRRPRALLGIGLGVTMFTSTGVWSATYDTRVRSARSEEQGPADPLTSDPGEPTTTSDPPGPRRWTAMLIGDTLLTRDVPNGADPFGVQSPALSSADIAIANLETAITTRGDRQSKEYTFRSRTELATRMRDAGIDIVSLANNHSLDYGTVGLDDTIAALIDAGVEPVGAGDSLAAAVEPVRRMVGGVRVAVFGASQVIPDPSWVATPERAGVASAGKHRIDQATEHLIASVQQATATSDVVIVMMHWGIEKQTCPTGIQIRVGRLLRKAGATAVIGTHPHVLQPIVRDEGGVVAYSIGNFIWDPRSGPSADTGIIALDFTDATLTGVAFHPHKLNGNGWGQAVRSSADRERIGAAVHRRCPGADGTTW